MQEMTLIEAAIKYGEMGLRVIPLLPKSKKPFMESWQDKATTDKQQIEAWWHENPNYNVGLAMGDGFVAIDFDEDELRDKHGMEVLREWEMQHGMKLPDTWIDLTPRGGSHYLYRDEVNYKNSVNKLYKGVDIRSKGACIAAYPSVREDGRMYIWEFGFNDGMEISEADDAVREFLKGDQQQENPEASTRENQQQGGNGFKLPESIAEGERNDTLFKYACQLQGKGLPDESIFPAVMAVNDERCERPLTGKEVKKIVESALKYDKGGSVPAGELPDERLVNKLIALDAANRYSRTDKGFAEMYADMFGDVSRYNPTKREYMFFDGVRWVLDAEGMRARNNAKKLADALRSYAGSYARLSADEISGYTTHILKLMQNRTRETMVKDVKDLNFFTSEQLDQDDSLLNCLNCVLDLSGDEPKAVEHSAELLLSKVCNAEYNPAAKCPLWERTLSEIMEGDADKVEYLQKLAGLALAGCTREEQLFFLYGGSTRNGKSTVAETFLFLLGDYAATISPESLAAKTRDSRQASPDLAKLQGVRLVVASEPPKKMLFDVSLVKTLTGRDRITARNLYESYISFVPKFVLLINTNYLPLIADDTIFKSDRVRVVPFERHFDRGEQNKRLKEQLRGEASGILNWMVQGLHKYRLNGLEPPAAVLDATNAYKTDSDKIGLFFSEKLDESPGENLAAVDVYEMYVDWCIDAGLKSEGKKNFYSELRSRGLFKESGTVDGKSVRNIVPEHTFAEFDGIDDGGEIPFM